MEDLQKQFKKVIITDGKYKSDFCSCFKVMQVLEIEPAFY